MIKTILLTCIVFCMFISVKAQESISRFSLEIAAGPSFPTGNFASKDTLKEDRTAQVSNQAGLKRAYLSR